MANIYSSTEEKAKDRYWLNQDWLPMEKDERVKRHLSECVLYLGEQIEKLNNLLGNIEDKENLKFMVDLYEGE